jgi:foldase protein PrsA
VGAKPGQRKAGTKRSVGRNRRALIIFAALFVVLFAGFAITQGIGAPSVPSGDVAVVKGVPDGNISEAEYKRSYSQQFAQSGLKKLPKPGSKKDEELSEAALGEILDSTWIKGEAEELGITVTDKQIGIELAQIKKTNFPNGDKEFQEFLRTSNFTEEEVEKRAELTVISSQLQARIRSQSPPATSSEISDYYDSVKDTQYTKPPSRDIRLIINKDKAEIEKAKQALEKDDSPANWKKVATKFSEDETTSKTGGLQKEITEEVLPANLKGPIFKSATGELEGPVSFQGKYLLVAVDKINPEKVQTLNEVKSEISTTLTQQTQEAFFNEFVTAYQLKWQDRTTCAAGHVIERCGNFKNENGHPSTAPASCYEANPKTPATECPAPVQQTTPALPGTTTLLKPQGERLVQRPRPEAPKKESKGAKAGEGAPAPEGAPSPETGAAGE